MQLKEYLWRKGLTIQQFADLCGYSHTHIERIKLKYSYPSAKLVRIIEKVTDGCVTRYDLLMDNKTRIKKV